MKKVKLTYCLDYTSWSKESLCKFKKNQFYELLFSADTLNEEKFCF